MKGSSFGQSSKILFCLKQNDYKFFNIDNFILVQSLTMLYDPLRESNVADLYHEYSYSDFEIPVILYFRSLKCRGEGWKAV